MFMYMMQHATQTKQFVVRTTQNKSQVRVKSQPVYISIYKNYLLIFLRTTKNLIRNMYAFYVAKSIKKMSRQRTIDVEFINFSVE